MATVDSLTGGTTRRLYSDGRTKRIEEIYGQAGHAATRLSGLSRVKATEHCRFMIIVHLGSVWCVIYGRGTASVASFLALAFSCSAIWFIIFRQCNFICNPIGPSF